MLAGVHIIRRAPEGLSSLQLCFTLQLWCMCKVSAYQKLAVFVMELDPVPYFHGSIPSCAAVVCLRVLPTRNVGHKELDRVRGHLGNVFQRYFTWRMHHTLDAILYSWKYHVSGGLGDCWIRLKIAAIAF